MARNNDRDRGNSSEVPRTPGRRSKKKVCIFCKDQTEWVDYKDVNLLRRFMSDRGKIRARRVTGNCAQHQRDVAVAIKTARELALLPYTQRTVSERSGGGRGRGRRRDEGEGGGEGAGREVEDAALADTDRRRSRPRSRSRRTSSRPRTTWRRSRPDAGRAAHRPGRRGEDRATSVDVADGYARNFLLPKGNAITATKGVSRPGHGHAPRSGPQGRQGPGGGRDRWPGRWCPRSSASRPGPGPRAGSSAR